MAEALAERLLDLHCRLLSLYVLQDADCLHWEDPHPFFEGERGSFVIQMWWLYMQGKMSSLQGCAANLFTRGLHHQAILSFFVFILTFESMDMQGILMHRYVCIDILMLVCNLYNVILSLYDPPVAHPWFFEIPTV
jgi:hypothetical protein